MTKSEFLNALLAIEKEKGIKRERLIEIIHLTLTTAFERAYRKLPNSFSVQIDPNTLDFKIFNDKKELKLEDLPRAQALFAKQFLINRLKEATNEILIEEFKKRQGYIITGIIKNVNKKGIYVDLEKADGIMPHDQRILKEYYSPGMKKKFLIQEIIIDKRDFKIILSRKADLFLQRLFEVEIPEIYEGIIKIVKVAREPGYRAKVAVTSSQKNIDPIGSCIGQRGQRIQNITNELSGERIDIVRYSEDPTVFIKNALLPAKVLEVRITEEKRKAVALVLKKDIPLAIGKKGENIKLASKLTGWDIDIKEA